MKNSRCVSSQFSLTAREEVRGREGWRERGRDRESERDLRTSRESKETSRNEKQFSFLCVSQPQRKRDSIRCFWNPLPYNRIIAMTAVDTRMGRSTRPSTRHTGVSFLPPTNIAVALQRETCFTVTVPLRYTTIHRDIHSWFQFHYLNLRITFFIFRYPFFLQSIANYVFTLIDGNWILKF